MHETLSLLHLKMCKKVAQLTRVIFYLNTKNDEYENNLKSVVNAYEQELDSPIKDVLSPSMHRPTPSSPSTRTPLTRPTRIVSWRPRSRGCRRTFKKKRRSLIRNFKSIGGAVRRGRPSRPRRPPGS